MSWGNKLLLAFIVFAALMGTLVYMCTQENFELVSKDYYADELRYQDKIDGTNNANKLSDVVISQTDHELLLNLPKEHAGLAIKGDLWFYCPTNAGYDRKMPLQVNPEGQMQISKSALAHAAYRVKITWQSGSEKFYKEVDLKVS